MGRGYLPPGRVTWPRPIKYLGEQVTLRAMKRVTFGTYPNEALRKQGFTPARLQGDWLPDKWLQLFSNELRVPQLAPGFQRRLLKLNDALVRQRTERQRQTQVLLREQQMARSHDRSTFDAGASIPLTVGGRATTMKGESDMRW